MLPSFKNPFIQADRKAAGMEPKPIQHRTDDVVLSDDVPGDKITKNPQTQPKGDDPLSNLESLWQPNMDAAGKEVIDDSDSGPYMPVLDAKKLEAMVGKMKFSDGITTEELAAIKAGGEESVGALMNMLDRAGRKSFTVSFQAASKLAEQGLTKAQERFMKKIPSHVRDMMVDNGLSDLPIMKNPLFKPLVDQTKARFLQKFPKANPEQVNAGIREYFSRMQKEFQTGDPKNKEVDDPAKKLRLGAPDANFEDWLGDELKGLGGAMFQDNPEDEAQN